MFGAIDRAASLQPRPSPDEDLRAELLRRQEEDQTVRLVPTAQHIRELYQRRWTRRIPTQQPSSIPPGFGLSVDLAERAHAAGGGSEPGDEVSTVHGLVSPPVVRVICLSVL